MTAQHDLSVLPGITPALRESLNAVGLHATSDLLRTNPPGLTARLPVVTVAQLRVWVTICRFVEIDGVTPAMAISLQAAGIDTLAELSKRTLAQLRAALSPLPAIPDDEALVRLLLEARRFDLTGVVNGTVVGSSGAPIAGAAVAGGGEAAVTDARGRFRLVGLRLGRPVAVTITNPGKAVRTFPSVAVHPSAALVGRSFRLPARSSAPTRLSALRGDTLPALGSAPVTTAAQSGAPTSDDLLVVVGFHANGDARAASLFLDFADGRFVVRTYRLPAAALPAGTATKHRLAPSAGGFVRARASARRVARQTRIRGIVKGVAGRAASPALVDKIAPRLLAAIGD